MGGGGGLVTFAPPRLPRPGPLVPWPRRRSLPPSPQARPRGASSRASHRARRRREGLPESRRESATSPQDGGRHHRDSPRRAPSPTRKKNPEDGARPGRSEQARGCGDAVRRREQELRPGIGGGAMGGAGVSVARCGRAQAHMAGSGARGSLVPSARLPSPRLRPGSA